MEKTKAQIEAEKYSIYGPPELPQINKQKKRDFIKGYQKAEEHSMDKIKEFAIAFAEWDGLFNESKPAEESISIFLQTKEAQDILNK